MRRVESNTRPEQTQLLQGKTLVNFDIQEVVKAEQDGTEYTMYSYEQRRLQKDAPQELIDKTIADELPVVLKARLEKELAALAVTTSNGNTFDANLESRANMADAILASETLGLTENIWRLTDNTEVLVPIGELREAHALALQAYATAKSIG